MGMHELRETATDLLLAVLLLAIVLPFAKIAERASIN